MLNPVVLKDREPTLSDPWPWPGSLFDENVLYAVFRCLIYLAVFSVVLVLAGFKVTNPRVRFYLCYTILAVLSNVIAMFGVVPALFYRGNKLRIIITGGISYLSYVVGVKYRVINENIFKEFRQTPAVIVANHQSLYDLLGLHFIYRKTGKLTILSRSDLLFTPYGLFYWLMGMITTVNRKNAKSRVESVKKCISVVKENHAKVWIFPEGTRHDFSNTSLLLPFKNGAFRIAIELQVPIFPVVFSPVNFIDYSKKEMEKGEVKIVALDPIPTTGLSLEDVDKLIDRVRTVMQAKLDLMMREDINSGVSRRRLGE